MLRLRFIIFYVSHGSFVHVNTVVWEKTSVNKYDSIHTVARLNTYCGPHLKLAFYLFLYFHANHWSLPNSQSH